VTGLNQYIHPSAATPFYFCGLLNGDQYYFAANGRTNGGPGGPSSPTISATPLIAPHIAGSAWSLNNPLSSQNIYGVGYASLTTCSNNATSAAGSFAAVGKGSAIFTSNDGLIWNTPTWNTPTSLPPGFDLYAVTGHAANLNNPGNPGLRWVAVGAGEGSVYSTDGINWYVGKVADPTLPSLRSLIQVAGTFFAVGDAGTILSSPDGIIWTAHISGITTNLNGVTHGGIYVAVGDSGTILTSGDGNTWTALTSQTISNLTTAYNLRQVTSNGGIIVAVGDSGTIVTSINGVWTEQQPLSGNPNLVAVAAESQRVGASVDNGTIDPALGVVPYAQFVAVDSTGNAYTSVDGKTWSSAISTSTSSLNALVSSGFGYVAAGNAGATAYAF
jgi:hypothetical protein